LSSSLPPDLIEQVRGRVRILALFLLVAFSFDPLVYFGIWFIATLAGYPVIMGQLGFRLLDLGAVAASGALWWVARSRVVSSERLHTLGLLYEVAICFIIGLTSFGQAYLQKGIIPSLTWVPFVVVLFPLILPGPPRRMLIAAFAAGAMAPLALLVLDLTGKVPVDGGAYFDAAFSSLMAIGFATMGARVVYRLGREVAAERELGSYRLEEKLGRAEQQIPPALDQLVLSCLAKDPADRPQSARELSQRLEAVDSGVWNEQHAREWWARYQPLRA